MGWVDPALEAADLLLSEYYQVQVAKVLNPADPQDFLVLISKLSDLLHGIAAPAERRAVAKALEKMDVDWKGMTPGQISVVTTSAMGALARPPVDWPKMNSTLRISGTDTTKKTRQAINEEHALKLAVKPSAIDEKVINNAANSTIFFVRDSYGKRVNAASNLARSIVSKGLEEGLSNTDIGEQLEKSMVHHQLNRSRSYYDMVASTYMARSRSASTLSSYTEAGFDYFKFVAIRDEVTTLQCRLMHGKRFSVAVCFQKVIESTELTDPEDIKYQSPWIRTGKNADGETELFVQDKGGARNPIATIKQNAMGQINTSGKFEEHASTDAITKLGCAVPPIHANCRSTIVPDSSVRTTSGNTVRTAPVPEEPKGDEVGQEKPKKVPEKKPEKKPEPKPEPKLEPKPEPPPEKKPELPPEKKPEPSPEKKPEPPPEKKPELPSSGPPINVSKIPGVVLANKAEVEDVQRLAGQLAHPAQEYCPGSFRSVKLADIRLPDKPVSQADIDAAIKLRRQEGRRMVLITVPQKDGTAVHIPGDDFSHRLALSQIMKNEGEYADAKTLHAHTIEGILAYEGPRKKITEQELSDLLLEYHNDAQKGASDQVSRSKARLKIREILNGPAGNVSSDYQSDKPLSALIQATPDNSAAGVAASHAINSGKISLAPETMRDMKSAANKLKYGAKFSQLSEHEQYALQVVLHEDSHGMSPMLPLAYQKHGAALEEVATELTARKALRDLFPGQTLSHNSNAPVYKNGAWQTTGAYPKTVISTMSAMTKAGIPADQAHDKFVDAIVKLRTSDYRQKPNLIQSPDEYVARVVDSMEGLTPAQKKKLTAEFKKLRIEDLD